MRVNIEAIKQRLSDPWEVARLLGCDKGAKGSRRSLMARCPAHGERRPSLRIRVRADGTLGIKCFGCQIYGDVIDLIAAIEGSKEAGLARAAELAGGACAAPSRAPEPQEERIPANLYAELAERICEAGKLDGRRWVREAEEYLEGRALLGLARAAGWAALPSLGRMLEVARGVCEAFGSVGPRSSGLPKDHAKHSSAGLVTSKGRAGASEQSGAFAFTPASLLVAAELARWDQKGKLRPLFGLHRLVIPWRDPDGRIETLQRRRLAWVPEGGWRDGAEPPKYIVPWQPAWPYGIDHFGGAGGVAICEGAADVLALRALHPELDVLGLQGLPHWREEWRTHFAGRRVRYALDAGELDRQGIVREDWTAAKLALSLRGRAAELPEKSETCVLCGTLEPWLCARHGRWRPRGKDWAEDWLAHVMSVTNKK